MATLNDLLAPTLGNYEFGPSYSQTVSALQPKPAGPSTALYTAPTQPKQTTQQPQPTQTKTGGQVLGATTTQPTYSGSTTTGGGSTSTPSVSDLVTQTQNADQQEANAAYNANVASVNNYFDTQKLNDNSLLTEQGQSRDNTVGAINSDAQDLISKVTDAANKNLEKLGLTKTQNDQNYDSAQTKVGNAFQDAQRVNRQTARGLNALDSSFYQGLQGNSAEDAATQVGNLITEGANNDATIANQENDVRTNLTNDTSTIENQALKARNDAYLTYQQNADKINNDITMNESQRQAALLQEKDKLDQSLNTIKSDYLNFKVQQAITGQAYGSPAALSIASFANPSSYFNGNLASTQALQPLSLSSVAYQGAGNPLYATAPTGSGGSPSIAGNVNLSNNTNTLPTLQSYLPTIGQ